MSRSIAHTGSDRTSIATGRKLTPSEAFEMLSERRIREIARSRDRRNDNVSPIAAVEAVRATGVSGPVFSSYQFGGYLVFVGIPPFIDSRGERYGDGFVERAFKAEVSAELADLTDLLSEYKIGWTLLATGSVGNLKLATLPDWKKLYADDVAVVYVRTGAIGRQDRSDSFTTR